MSSKFFKKRVFRIRSESPDFGFSYGGGYKNERSYSSASESTNSMSSESEYTSASTAPSQVSSNKSQVSSNKSQVSSSKSQVSSSKSQTSSGRSQTLNKTHTNGKPHIPQHPIPSLQGPFIESMKCPDVDVENALNPKGMDLKYHPLIKVIAQIAFGLHLLHKKLAKSETEVVKILQRHVDDINKFLNKSTLKFDTALTDIEERQKNLKTAIDNSSVFERMLATDPVFRQQIADGNQKVEAVVKKTTASMDKNLKDVHEGMRALVELTKYMNSIRKGWKNTGLVRTYGVMVSNVEVWGRCFESLRKAALNLALSLEKLKSVMGQVDRRVKRSGKPGSRRKPSLTKDAVRVLKHAKSLPGLPIIPQRRSSLRIRESALAPLGLRSMFLPDSEISLVSSAPPNLKPNLKIQCDNLQQTMSLQQVSDKSTFLNVDESDYEDPEQDSPTTVTSLTPRPRRPNHWKPLPPTPLSPPASMLAEFPRPATASGAPVADISLAPPVKSPDDKTSPLTIELCLEGCLDDYTSMFQLRPIYDEKGLVHSKSCSPITTIRPLTLRPTPAA
ncbi:hypothetical protein H072_10107 [Dactylellina haptotyla CBS 200.50]|uniref:Uncharacterized protein n=1 Tax=Dactylellina haptotyla (strain CBS 200.50) TaxID=1284197 RepID=S8A5M4_DACHA|nr:hypothetical protein H072_10107 [Dactylellina haptotyla CBS 200.50]